MKSTINSFARLIMPIVVLVLTLFSAHLWAQRNPGPSGRKAILTIKSTPDFEVTADTNNNVWRNTPWMSMTQRNQNHKLKSTKIKLQYSTKGIYCLFWCEDDTITATPQEDFADLYNEDVVEIFFWTDERHPLYFEYELSPLNFELPILVPNDRGDFFGWRPWHYEGERKTRHAAKIYTHGQTTVGWAAEFFIPYALMKPLGNVPPTKGDKWRVNMYRLDYDNGNTRWTWQPIQKNFHDYKSFGTMIFD